MKKYKVLGADRHVIVLYSRVSGGRGCGTNSCTASILPRHDLVAFGSLSCVFMQAGFAMVEIGLTRAKNSGNIIMKNLMDFSVGALFYWAIGWALMYGSSVSGLFGFSQFFILKQIQLFLETGCSRSFLRRQLPQ